MLASRRKSTMLEPGSPQPQTFSDFPTQALMPIAARPELVFVRGEGSWLFDSTGKGYLDFVQGWAVNSLGHAPAAIQRALLEQSRLLLNPSPAFFNGPSAALARRLVERSCFDRVFFASTGAEANEGAVKLARKWGSLQRGGAYEIITFRDAFHGRSLAMMAASGKPGWDQLFEPKVPGFPKATLNDLASVEALVNERTVAVMLEPIQGEGGVVPASDRFLQELRELTRARGLLLMVDEVQTGMGRTGRLFCHEHAGIEPDVMTLGKGIGGGVPLAALLAKEEVCCFAPGDQGGTYNGNPLMTAVGLAVADVLTAPGFLQGVAERGELLRAKLSELSAELGLGEVRGRGLLLALDTREPIAAQVVELARSLGLLLNACRPATLRFMPALTVSDDEIRQMVSLLREALTRLKGEAS